MTELLLVLTLALGAGNVVMACLLAARRGWLVHAERRRARDEARVRPIAFRLIEGEEASLGSLTGHEARALAAVLEHYGRNLKGRPQTRIAEFFERSGHVSHELAALSSRRAWRRALAAQALGGMGSARAVPALSRALEDPQLEVRAAAARSMGRLAAERAVPALVGALASGTLPRPVAGSALLSIGPATVPDLQRQLSDPDPRVREAACELLGLLCDISSGGTIRKCLRELVLAPGEDGPRQKAEAEVRAKAARALGQIGDGSATAALARALSDPFPFVRVAAAHALGAIGDPSAAGRLARQARDDLFDPARAAAHALARLDPERAQAAADRPDGGPYLREAADLTAVRVA